MNPMLEAVLQATLISKCVLVLLLFMSVASWAYMCGKWMTLRSAQRRTQQGLVAFDDAGGLNHALPVMEADRQSPLYGITRRAVREFNRLTRTGDTERLLNDNVRRALHFAIAEEVARLKSSLPCWPRPPTRPRSSACSALYGESCIPLPPSRR